MPSQPKKFLATIYKIWMMRHVDVPAEVGDALTAQFRGNEGMQHFDGEIAKLVRSGLVDLETGLGFASNATVLGQELAR